MTQRASSPPPGDAARQLVLLQPQSVQKLESLLIQQPHAVAALCMGGKAAVQEGDSGQRSQAACWGRGPARSHSGPPGWPLVKCRPGLLLAAPRSGCAFRSSPLPAPSPRRTLPHGGLRAGDRKGARPLLVRDAPRLLPQRHCADVQLLHARGGGGDAPRPERSHWAKRPEGGGKGAMALLCSASHGMKTQHTGFAPFECSRRLPHLQRVTVL